MERERERERERRERERREREREERERERENVAYKISNFTLRANISFVSFGPAVEYDGRRNYVPLC